MICYIRSALIVCSVAGCVIMSVSLMARRLSQDWDACSDVRVRLRQTSNLLLVCDPEDDAQPTNDNPGCNTEPIPKTVAVARWNKCVLLPVLGMMSEEPGLKMLVIDVLIAAVGDLYKMHKIDASICKIYQHAWGVRRLCQLIKARLYKPNPVKDPWILFYRTRFTMFSEVLQYVPFHSMAWPRAA